MKIESTRNVAAQKIKALVAGPSGAGKTYSIASLLEAGYTPLVASFEAGLMSLSGAGKSVDFIDGTKDEDGKTIPKEDRAKRLKEIFQFLKTPECAAKYDTIVLDSVTEISQCLYDGLKKEFPDRKDSLVLYGELGQRSREVLKAFRDLDYHVVMTCLTKIDKDDNGRRFVAFDMIGSISDKLLQFFDGVYYIRVTPEGKREFVCNATDAISAKDRSSKLSAVELSLGGIFQKILNQGETNVRSV